MEGGPSCRCLHLLSLQTELAFFSPPVFQVTISASYVFTRSG
jgi:hypothetical protein